jgi:hypothetical protein
MARSHYRSIGNEMVMLTADDVIPYGRPMRRSQPQLIIAWDWLQGRFDSGQVWEFAAELIEGAAGVDRSTVNSRTGRRVADGPLRRLRAAQPPPGRRLNPPIGRYTRCEKQTRRAGAASRPQTSTTGRTPAGLPWCKATGCPRPATVKGRAAGLIRNLGDASTVMCCV